MMKNSGLLRWTNNNKNNSSSRASHGQGNGTKAWLHAPEMLQKGHIAYFVKFLGSTAVDEPKGIEVVKESIRKLTFSQQLRKAEGVKTPKIELTISVHGIAISEPKTKRKLHEYPLHHISYCADDKAEKRFFSFIAKEADSDQHTCYVFVSDKLVEDITLTIGQAFELAYRHFLETSGREVGLRKQVATLQDKLKAVESENEALRRRLEDVGAVVEERSPSALTQDHQHMELLDISGETSTDPPESPPSSGYASPPSFASLPPVPHRNPQQPASPGHDDFLDSPSDGTDSDFDPRAEDTKNEEDLDPSGADLLAPTGPAPIIPSNGVASHDDFDPRAEEKVCDFDPRAEEKWIDFDPRGKEKRSEAPLVTSRDLRTTSPPPLIPPPRPARPHEHTNAKSINSSTTNNSSNTNNNSNSRLLDDDLFNIATPSVKSNDPLAQFIDMKAGFNRGLSFGTTDIDFNLDSLDPLKN